MPNWGYAKLRVWKNHKGFVTFKAWSSMLPVVTAYFCCIFCLLVCWTVPKDFVLSGGSSSILTCSALTEIWNMKKCWCHTSRIKIKAVNVDWKRWNEHLCAVLCLPMTGAQAKPQRQTPLTTLMYSFENFPYTDSGVKMERIKQTNRSIWHTLLCTLTCFT